MENQAKKIKIEKKVDSLLKITFDYITKKCKNVYDEKTNQILNINWHEASLFCLASKIKHTLFTDGFSWSLCTCKPTKCKRYCLDPDHICCNCRDQPRKLDFLYQLILYISNQ